MLRLALFGHPVSDSLSPRIHAAFGRQLGIDLEYRAIDTPPEAFPERLDGFARAGGMGANLTVPLKQSALDLCAEITPAARRAGAINTLRRKNETWSGHNTDGAGLLLDFARLGLEITGKKILILGAGGAARGVLPALLDEDPAGICVLNRTPAAALALVQTFDAQGNIRGGGLAQGPGGVPFDLVIQATSLGHQGQCPPLEPAWLNPDAAAYDLNYGPAFAPFHDRCRALSLPVSDGLGMLLAQAALSFEIWTGQRPDPWSLIQKLRSV